MSVTSEAEQLLKWLADLVAEPPAPSSGEAVAGTVWELATRDLQRAADRAWAIAAAIDRRATRLAQARSAKASTAEPGTRTTVLDELVSDWRVLAEATRDQHRGCADLVVRARVLAPREDVKHVAQGKTALPAETLESLGAAARAIESLARLQESIATIDRDRKRLELELARAVAAGDEAERAYRTDLAAKLDAARGRAEEDREDAGGGADGPESRRPPSTQLASLATRTLETARGRFGDTSRVNRTTESFLDEVDLLSESTRRLGRRAREVESREDLAGLTEVATPRVLTGPAVDPAVETADEDGQASGD
ncbi:hypothetical protein G5V58_21725 [Nocardioides anomalus]|uniref:Uncharacterized protein n=2 Tax=Nocardioides anomalus TaxID=2712223 RepID=A0A6G6WIQ3_9ACTN|nr:hypothetical protein G5V58_21725 [Nocardioides anomalus]